MGLQELILVFKVTDGIISMNQSLLMVGDPPLGIGGPQNRDFGYFS